MNWSPGLVAFRLAFEVSPIILTNGIASMMGGMLPMISITEGLNFAVGILSGGNVGLDSFFANFQPLPGSSLIEQQVGNYPFANQNVAANATIAQPLTISMLMICPVRQRGGYFTKTAIMSTLQKTLALHNNSGGTYTIATPSYFYTDCLMTGFRDASSGDPKQPQDRWRIDFVQPLVTLQQASQVQNSLMNKLTSGMPTNGDLSGPGALNSVSATPGVTSQFSPAASGSAGTAVAGSPSLPFGL
jgi:hypothetical protein